MTASVRLRHSLVLRLFALVTGVAVVAVAVTAWLTVRTTAVGLRDEQGELVAASARIEAALVEYAATHRDWSEAGPVVARLAESTGNRVTVADDTGRVLADSAAPGTAVPPGDPTTIDALDTGPAVLPDLGDPRCPVAESCPVAEGSYAGERPGSSPIAQEAVGPLALDDADRAESAALASRAATCLSDRGDTVTVTVTATGRSVLEAEAGPDQLTSGCDLRTMLAPLASERAPLRQLQRSVDRCLERRDATAIDLLPDLSWVQDLPRTPSTDRAVVTCLTAARRQLLTPYVAPAANLYVSSTRQEPTSFLDLSSGNRWRIAGFATLVLLVALGFTALAGRQLVRPLARLATAAGRAREGDLSARAEVRSRDEIGAVADAFNTMADRREESEQLRRAMVGDVAHELRNPISTMRGTLEAAQDGLVPVDAALVSSLMEETLLLQHVVEDLRDLAAADSGDLRLALAPLRVAEVLEHVAGVHRADALARGVTIDVDAAEVVVRGDVLRLRQVVGNLTSNAVRHSPDGGTVTLVARGADRADGAGGAVELAVVDHGEGIAAGDREHVFERFWRADPSRTRASGGSGLGLAIVRQLVEAHGGTVAVEETPGGGASFVVRLPS